MNKKGDSKIPNHHFKTGRELTRETIKAFERLTETFLRHIRQYAHMHPPFDRNIEGSQFRSLKTFWFS